MLDIIGHTTWKTYNDDWHQKTYINNAGEPVYTYYHQNKSSSPALAIEINTPLARHYSSYTLIEKDLQDILQFIDIVRGLISTEGKIADLTIKGLSRAITITYGKCFTESHGRKVKLEKSIIPDDLKDAHEKLMDMRHNHVAHAGTSTHENCTGVLVIPAEKKAKKYGRNIPQIYFTEAYQTLTSEIIVSKQTRLLIEYIQNSIKKKLAKIGKDLNKKYASLDFDKIYTIAKKKKTNRIQLNENDIKKLLLNTKS